MRTKKSSSGVDVKKQAVDALPKPIRKRTYSKYKSRSSNSHCGRQCTQSAQLIERSIKHCQRIDLVKYVKQRRVVSFDPSYSIDTLLSIFDKATGGQMQHLRTDLANFDIVSSNVDAFNEQNDYIKCEEVRFFNRYTLLRYDMDFEAVCTWKKINEDAKIWLRNTSFQVDILGMVSGSTWLITLMYFPLALAMTSRNVVDSQHMATAGINGMRIGAPIGACIGSCFGRVGLALGGMIGSLMGIATAFTGSYLDRRL